MKTIYKINALLFALLITGIGVTFLFEPNKMISINEKRKLAEFPQLTYSTYVDGSFSDGFDSYVNDRFPSREELIALASTFKDTKGYSWSKGIKIVTIKKKPKINLKNKNQKNDSTEIKMNLLNDYEESYSGNMLIINGAVFTLNAGSAKMGALFGKMLSEYAKEFKDSVRVFSCVPPLSSAFIPVSKYASYNQKNTTSLLGIKDGLSDGALFVDVMTELNKHINEKLFFKTDHHWTPLGAYYGYTAFCKTAGFTAVPLENMEKRTKYKFLGTLYELTRDKSVRENPDTMDYFIPKVETSAIRYPESGYKKPYKSSLFCHGCSGGNSYSTFLCGDIPLLKITTNIKNGKKALVIKNSMGNAFSVYLVNHYEEIYIQDFRYSEHNIIEIVRSNHINDVIFAVGLYGAMSQGTIKRMRNLGFNNGKVKKIQIVPPDSLQIPKKLPQDSIKNE